MADLHCLTAEAAAAVIASGEISSVELVEACLARIEATDRRLHAWVFLDPERALNDANEADRDRKRRGPRGPLHGVPFGVKDVLDVAGWPTCAGFSPFDGRTARVDSAVVAQLKAAGAIPIGKLSTAQFAVSDPPATVSPWDASLTPGGSSTGSGVAVAAQNVPIALGTQTGGSILRPAAYNGVVGFKPSFGTVPTGGLIPTAPSLDHIGVIARSVGDCALFLDSCSPPASPRPDVVIAPRIGVVREAVAAAEDSIREAVLGCIDSLCEAGVNLVEVDFGVPFETFAATYRVIMQSEVAAIHVDLFREHRQHYGPQLRAYLDAAYLIPGWVTAAAGELRSRLYTRFTQRMEAGELDALILPATPSQPPQRESTGSSAYLSPFSLLGVPTIALPAGVRGGLPQSIQLVGRRDADWRLLSIARWCESVLGPGELPMFDS